MPRLRRSRTRVQSGNMGAGEGRQRVWCKQTAVTGTTTTTTTTARLESRGGEVRAWQHVQHYDSGYRSDGCDASRRHLPTRSSASALSSLSLSRSPALEGRNPLSRCRSPLLFVVVRRKQQEQEMKAPMICASSAAADTLSHNLSLISRVRVRASLCESVAAAEMRSVSFLFISFVVRFIRYVR